MAPNGEGIMNQTTANQISLRFIRYGLGIGLLGIMTGYLPLFHYLMSDSTPSCPSAPIHGHLILLSFLGMSVFGLLYKALPDFLSPGSELPENQINWHFRLSVIALIGILINGTVGYEYLNHFHQQGFYYLEDQGQSIRNIWFAIDGVFLSLYAVGVWIMFNLYRKAS